MLRWVSVLLACLSFGCATSRVVRLDTGEGEPLLYAPPERVSPIDVDPGDFQRAMTRLVLEMRFSVRPEEASRSRLQRATWAAESPSRGRDYGAWCSRQDDPGECLTLLEDGFTFLDADVRRKMALSFAWDGVWDGVQQAVQEFVNPLVLKAMITSAMAAYMLLVVAPEPVTKLVALALTTYVIAYIGLDAFTNLVMGWQRLSADSARATSFRGLEDAGRDFGEVMGANGARVLIMALTAALGGGAANLASKGPLLPGFARAVLATEVNAGFLWSAVMSGGVRSIAVAEGVLTVGLAPNAVAMSARTRGGQDEASPGRPSQEPLHENQMPEQLASELEMAEQLGVRPVRVDSPDFMRYASEERIKWVVTADNQLQVIPYRWQGVEISHAVASGGRPVLAAGEAELAVHGTTRFGIRIEPLSGHFLNGVSKAVSDSALEIGRRAFARHGITFPP
ncbi:SitA5 family polymorphic toxin [Myxococcus faecalis]|uniref:SitA5 family polymorphic toxin n=1 Tax=Myxococcus faecalis TaxID=3115646 RepID=UPI003DA40687